MAGCDHDAMAMGEVTRQPARKRPLEPKPVHPMRALGSSCTCPAEVKGNSPLRSRTEASLEATGRAW